MINFLFYFLTVFLLAAAAFMVFAFKQDVNLVHQDYYEQGADYTDQMNIDSRSAKYADSIHTHMENGFFIVEFDESLAAKMDTVTALMYRPSDSDDDLMFSMNDMKRLEVPRSILIPGRYILKLYWYSEGLKYEVDQQVSIH